MWTYLFYVFAEVSYKILDHDNKLYTFMYLGFLDMAKIYKMEKEGKTCLSFCLAVFDT